MLVTGIWCALFMVGVLIDTVGRLRPDGVATFDRASIDALDSGHMLTDILGMPEQLGDALWRVESAIMQDWDTTAGVVVAGMGGSAIGGALARAALGIANDATHRVG